MVLSSFFCLVDQWNPNLSAPHQTPKQADTGLRLLNYQNNLISKITNLTNLPNLIFIDLYNNYIDTLEGPLSTMTGLRVMMVGKNKIDKVCVWWVVPWDTYHMERHSNGHVGYLCQFPFPVCFS